MNVLPGSLEGAFSTPSSRLKRLAPTFAGDRKPATAADSGSRIVRRKLICLKEKESWPVLLLM
jgi:hypothetical protein